MTLEEDKKYKKIMLWYIIAMTIAFSTFLVWEFDLHKKLGKKIG